MQFNLGSKSQDSGKDKQVKTNSEKKMLDELNEIRGKYQRVVEENAMLENQVICFFFIKIF